MKTVETEAGVDAFLAGLENRRRAQDAAAARDIMARATGREARMWGDAIIGFGAYNYDRKDGSRGRLPLIGLSPRKSNLVLYIMDGFAEYAGLLERLGPHKKSKTCLYLGRLDKIDRDALAELITLSHREMTRRYG
jgi:hypothetical protein